MIILVLTLLHHSRSCFQFVSLSFQGLGPISWIAFWVYCSALDCLSCYQWISKWKFSSGYQSRAISLLGLADPQALCFSRSHFSGSSCWFRYQFRWELIVRITSFALELSLWQFHGIIPLGDHQPWSVSVIYKPRSDVETSCLRWAISIIKCIASFERSA